MQRCFSLCACAYGAGCEASAELRRRWRLHFHAPCRSPEARAPRLRGEHDGACGPGAAAHSVPGAAAHTVPCQGAVPTTCCSLVCTHAASLCACVYMCASQKRLSLHFISDTMWSTFWQTSIPVTPTNRPDDLADDHSQPAYLHRLWSTLNQPTCLLAWLHICLLAYLPTCLLA